MSPPRRHYEDTSVSEAKSLMDIEAMLRRHGVETMRWTTGSDLICVEFAWPYRGTTLPFRINLALPLKNVDGISLEPRQREQERRRMLRVLFNHIKAKLVAVEEGLVDMEQEFLPYLLGPGGVTVGETMGKQIAQAAEEGTLPEAKLLPGPSKP